MAESEDTVLWGEHEWQVAEQAAEDWVKNVLGRYRVDVFWRDRPLERLIQAPHVELAFGDEVPVGTDEVLTEVTPQGTIRTRITGLRRIVLSAKVRSRDQSTFRMAKKYAAILRQSIEHPVHEGRLRDAGLGLEEALPVRPIPMVNGDRVESFALVEVRFNLAQEYVDEDADADMHWVERVELGVSVAGEPAEPFTVRAYPPLEGAAAASTPAPRASATGTP